MSITGEFTTCGWDRPSWTFTAKEVKLTMGDYATARSTTFSILDHKVLYLPWSVFPVKTERQSGFLLPEFQLSSRDGTILQERPITGPSQRTRTRRSFSTGYRTGASSPASNTATPHAKRRKACGTPRASTTKITTAHRYQIKGEHQQISAT